MSEELEHFKKKYRAHIQQGNRRYYKPKRISVDPLSASCEPFDLNFETECSVQIDMSQRDFEQLLHMEKHFYDTMQQSGPYIGAHAKYIVEEYEREERIRNDNPSVKKAYEKYQTLMRLVDTKYNR